MTTSTHLMRRRRFLPLFLTQLLNAFNDNLYKNAMVLFVVYTIYDSPEAETLFSGLATGLFVIPFLLRTGVNFWLALLLGCLLTVGLYLGMTALAPRLGTRL